MCNLCKDTLSQNDIQDRLERLESFIWKRDIAADCDYRTYGICCIDGSIEGRLCMIDICKAANWIMR